MTNSYAWLQKLLLCGFTLLASTPVHAQITPDNTLGAESSRFTPNVPIEGENGARIDGGATRGNNVKTYRAIAKQHCDRLGILYREALTHLTPESWA